MPSCLLFWNIISEWYYDIFIIYYLAGKLRKKNSFGPMFTYWADDKQSKARNSDSKYRQMALVGFGT